MSERLLSVLVNGLLKPSCCCDFVSVAQAGFTFVSPDHPDFAKTHEIAPRISETKLKDEQSVNSQSTKRHTSSSVGSCRQLS